MLVLPFLSETLERFCRCCVSVIIHHTKEERVINRGVGFVLCFGGLTFFGILVGTISANTRLKLEALRSGQNSAVVESDHIVVAGTTLGDLGKTGRGAHVLKVCRWPSSNFKLGLSSEFRMVLS